jgi:dynein heavy chain
MLIFTYTWAAGGNIYDSLVQPGQHKFSKFIKSKILAFYTNFPFEGELFDYYIEWKTKDFKPWK